jgi:cobyrinic acid a,c-diamide synthase
MPHLLISAAHKSSGKTTLSIGLCAALKNRGLIVQPFKKGPDYIDPLWLSEAAGRACYNLDFYTMSREEIIKLMVCRSRESDISIIEANKGLYDGLDLDGSNSNAALAKLVNAPVILVLSTKGMTRGIAPLILGYQQFDKDIHIAGVILNQVGGSRHEEKLRAIIEHYTNVKILGAVQFNPELNIDERHLGLIPSNEIQVVQHKIQTIATIVSNSVNLDQLLSVANFISPTVSSCSKKTHTKPHLRLGILRDQAFGFYYPEDLDNFQRLGAELVFIDALQDQTLPEIDGLFIGGGFPEMYAEQLSSNFPLKKAILNAIENNLPVYAECGGLMYLANLLILKEKNYPMVGALDLDTQMFERPQGRGYVHLKETGKGLWDLGNETTFAAHEFHYSKAINISPNLQFAYKVLRGMGIDGEHDGIVYKNTLASYTHLRTVDQNRWTDRFIQFIENTKQSR